MMKKMTYLAGITALLFSQFSTANTLILPSPHEPDLIGAGGILDVAFGLENLQRIDDDLDQFWDMAGSETVVSVLAKYAGYTQDFSFIDSGNNVTSLFTAASVGQATTFDVADSGSPFRFGLDPSGSPFFSSAPTDNIYCSMFACTPAADHMVTWLISGGKFAGDYVIGWEDLLTLGDRDYNDLVIRVSGAAPVSAVPVPAAVWLFGSGLFGLVAVARRRD